MPQTGWLRNCKHFLLTVPESGRSAITADSVFREGFLVYRGCCLTACSQGALWVSFYKAADPQDLFTSQRPRLPILSPFRVRVSINEFGEQDTTIQTTENSKVNYTWALPWRSGLLVGASGGRAAVRHPKRTARKGKEDSPCRVELWAGDLLSQSQAGKVTLGESPQSAGL